MATVEDFKYVLTLWKERELPHVIERDIKLDLAMDKIITIVGVRRAGKTSVMFQHIRTLIDNEIKRDNIVYVDFENERLVGAKATDLDNLLIAHLQLFRPDGLVYLFLDEIQNIDDWDKWVRKIYDTKKYRIIITGSSSKLLSREIATALAGRNLTYIVYPFSFDEFLRAKGIKVDRTKKYSAEKGVILRELNEFLEHGSFPEIALLADETKTMEVLSAYFDAIFLRDIVKRYNVREVGELNIFLKVIANNYASYFSSVKSYNYFASMGRKVSRATLLNFLDYSTAVFMVYTLEQYMKSARKRLARQVKSYIIDIGIAGLFADIDRGRALENAVFLQLLRIKKPLETLNYLKLKSGKEVDFFVGGKAKSIIQVAYDVSSAETRAREASALVEAASALKLSEGTIITYDYQGMETIEGIKITYRPFWQWALDI